MQSAGRDDWRETKGTIMKRFIAETRVVLLLGFFAFLWSTAHAQITPSADSYTVTGDPSTNYGAKTLLDVESPSQTTYIQFNLSSIPSTYTSADITKATLKLYVGSVGTAGSFNVDYVTGTWTESTITANLVPALGTTIAASVPLVAADKNQFILIDVTEAVQAWLSGTPNDGIALVGNSPFNATFDSKESTSTSHAPELDIVFAGGGTLTGVTTASGSGLSGGGTSGTLNLGLLTTCASGQVLQWKGSAWACSAVGTGTITGVTAGTALTGGGTGGNVTLNLNTAQVPLLAANNTFTGNNLFDPCCTDAIDAYTSDPGKTALVGIEHATSGGSYGVWAETYDASGAGVKGTNSGGTGGIGVYGTGDTGVFGTGTSYGFQTDSNAQQARTAGGWVKAMVYFDGQDGGGLARCYNSTLAGAAATTPPCGFTVTASSAGFEINFGFEVDDRFLALNLQRCSCGSEVPIWFATPQSANVISVDVVQAGTSNQIPAQWHLIVF
jgi:hypothetical protein